MKKTKITKEETIRRLRRLAWLMNNVSEPSVKKKTGLNKLDQIDYKCGTSACAAGWAASWPWFQERGLSLEADGFGRWNIKFSGFKEKVHYSFCSSLHHLSQFFGISYECAADLFGAEKATPKQKACEIEKVIASISFEK